MSRVLSKALNPLVVRRISNLLSGPRESLSDRDIFLLGYLLAVAELSYAKITGGDVEATRKALEIKAGAAQRLGIPEEEIFDLVCYVRDMTTRGRLLNEFIGELKTRLGEENRN